MDAKSDGEIIKLMSTRHMITVAILINGEVLYARSAVRISKIDGVGRYAADTGEIIEHTYDDGAVVLAKQMLDTIIECEDRK